MNSYGKIFKVSIYGESHQEEIGLIMDGFPAGILVDYELIKRDLLKRKPQEFYETKRIEEDDFVISSGVYLGYSTGAPIKVSLKNKDFKSVDYQNIKDVPRPSHADFVGYQKFKGYNDYRGGGHFSGRITALLVIAGSFAKMVLPFKFLSQLLELKGEKDSQKWDALLALAADLKDSVGGVIKLTVSNLIVGLGSPFFGKANAKIAEILFSIPGVKSVGFGIGLEGKDYYGSQYNDAFISETGHTKTNNSGGINGGITNGNDIVVNVFMKPTSSIGRVQKTFSLAAKKIVDLELTGRHDIAFVRRAMIVVENAVAVSLLDMYLEYKAYE